MAKMKYSSKYPKKSGTKGMTGKNTTAAKKAGPNLKNQKRKKNEGY